MQTFKAALVGLDYSPAEESLLSCLPDLARWGVEAVVLAHVIRIGYTQGSGYLHEDEYAAWLERRAEPLRQAGLRVRVSVTVSGVPAEELLSVARAEGADLVVVGSRSHDFLHDMFLGSVAREVIRKAEIPVLVQRLEPTEAGKAESCVAVCDATLKRILLATDISEQSRAAEGLAAALAAGAEQIDVLTILSDVAAADERMTAENRHQELVRRIVAAGGKASSRIERGSPAETIGRIGGEGYSLIIVGKHGRNWVADKLIGSTAAKVCEIAGRPVLMVPLQKE